jgi:hypothetical protein
MSTWTQFRDAAEAWFISAEKKIVDFLHPTVELLKDNLEKFGEQDFAAAVAAAAAAFATGGESAALAAAVAALRAVASSQAMQLGEIALHSIAANAAAKAQADVQGPKTN